MWFYGSGIRVCAGDKSGLPLEANRKTDCRALNICVGSAIQIALVVAPRLVLISAFMDRPINPVFHNPLYLFAIASTAFFVNAVARDGENQLVRGPASGRGLSPIRTIFLLLPVLRDRLHRSLGMPSMTLIVTECWRSSRPFWRPRHSEKATP